MGLRGEGPIPAHQPAALQRVMFSPTEFHSCKKLSSDVGGRNRHICIVPKRKEDESAVREGANDISTRALSIVINNHPPVPISTPASPPSGALQSISSHFLQHPSRNVYTRSMAANTRYQPAPQRDSLDEPGYTQPPPSYQATAESSQQPRSEDDNVPDDFKVSLSTLSHQNSILTR